MPRPRRRQPDPARFPPCARCGQCYPGGADRWPEGRVCKYCYLQARLRTGTCADCGALTSLPGLNATGQPTCTRCSGIPARFRCGCGREVTAGERGRCWWCVLAGLVTDALAGPDGAGAHPPAAAGGRAGVDAPPAKRRGMATPERDNARDLAGLGAGPHPLQPRRPGCRRGGPRCRIPALAAGPLRRAAAPRPAPGRLSTLGRRQARRHRQCQGTASCSNGSSAGACCATCGPAAPRAARPRPLPAGQAAPHRGDRCSWHGWPTADGNSVNAPSTISTSGSVRGPTTRRHAIAFLSWARQQRILRDVDVPVISTAAEPRPARPDPDARLAAIRRLLLDQTLAPGDRIAGCLVALYGQQASRIAALRSTDTSCADGATRIKFGTDWLDVPEPIATLLRQHLDNRRNMTTADQPDLAVAVSRAARRRTPQLPPGRPCPSPTRRPCPGEPAGHMARTRP